MAVAPAALLPLTSISQDRILALNNAHAAELSWLDPAGLDALLAQAFSARAAGDLDGFLIALDQGADDASPKFRWFQARYGRFVYVDRVVVAPSARGGGVARRLYADLFERAQATGHTRIVCEVNLDPPNPSSDAFHAALGFTEVGRADIHGGSKIVRYLAHDLQASGR